MPEVNDIVDTTIVSELSGVQMSTRLLWKVDDLGAEDSIFDNISKIAIQFAASVEAYVSSAWGVTCITYQNLSRIEEKVVAPIIANGISIVDAHPQNQTLVIRRWGQYIPDGKFRNGRIMLSGVTEDFSTRGRFNDMSEASLIEAMLGEIVILLAGGWTITPMLEITPDWVNFPENQAFVICSQAEMNPVFSVLTGRRTKLCGTA